MRQCEIDGCEAKHLARGLCRKHYNREWTAENRESQRESNRKWREANPEKKRESTKRHHEASPLLAKRRRVRRTLKAKGYSPVPQRWTVRNDVPLDQCYYCGEVLEGTDWHLEHVHPLSKGGPIDASNEVRACGSCNVRKFNMTPLVWYARQF